MSYLKRGRVALAAVISLTAIIPAGSQEPGYYYRQLKTGPTSQDTQPGESTGPLVFGLASQLPSEAMVGVAIPAVGWTLSGGKAPYFVIATGAPSGLSTTGVLSGTPEQSGNFPITLTARDSSSPAKTHAVSGSMIVYPPFEAIPSATPQSSAQVGQAIAPVTVVANGGKPPYTFGVDGTLPVGVGINPTTGLLSGSPQEPGTFAFRLRASESFRPATLVASDLYMMVVAPAPLYLSVGQSPPTETMVGATFGTTLSASGSPAPYVFTGMDLPPGLSVTGTNFGGTFSTAGTFSYSLKAANSQTSATRQFTTIVYDAFAASLSAAPQTSVEHEAAITPVTITASGGKTPYAYGASGSLPPGVTVNSSTGVLSGAPTSPGTFTFALTATQALIGAAPISSSSFTLTVTPKPLELTGTASVSKIVSRTQVVNFLGAKATGGTAPYTYVVESGNLPIGTSLTSDGDLVGTANTNGGYGATIKVTDSSPTPRTATYPLNVQVVPEVEMTNTAVQAYGTVQTPYPLAVFTPTGGSGNYTYAVGGTIPPGLDLDANGSLTGTPTAAGSYTFSVTAVSPAAAQSGFTSAQQSSLLQKTSQSFTIVVSQPLQIATTALSNATATQAYTSSLSITGGRAPYAWSPTVTNIPGGFTMATANATNGTGTLSGTTTETNPRDLTFTVTDADGRTATKTLNLVLAPGTANANRNLIDQVTSSVAEGYYPTGGAPAYSASLSAAQRLAVPKDGTVYAFNSTGGSPGIGFYVRNGASATITHRFSQQVLMSGFSMLVRNVGTGTLTITVETSADNNTWTPAGTYNFNTNSPGFVSDGFYGNKSGPATGTFATPRQAFYVKFSFSNSCQTSQCAYLTGQGTAN